MVKLIYHLSKVLSLPFYFLSVILNAFSFTLNILADEIYHWTTYKIWLKIHKKSFKK